MKKPTQPNPLLEALMNRTNLEPLTLKGNGATVWLRKLTVGDRSKMVDEFSEHVNQIRLTMHLILISVCDELGNPIFEDIETVEQMDCDLAEELALAINKLNGFDKTAEDVEKN